MQMQGDVLPIRTQGSRAPLSEELSLAATVIAAFESGSDLESQLSAVFAQSNQQQTAHKSAKSMPSTAAVKEFVYRAVRQGGTLRALLNVLNQRLPAPWVLALQKVVLAQLITLQEGDDKSSSRLVAQAVEAVKGNRENAFAAGFLNATLRRFLRERMALMASVGALPEALYNHPVWWIEQLKVDHPQHWQSILQAGNGQAPMTLRVNNRLVSAEQYLELLQREQIAAVSTPTHASHFGVILDHAVPPQSLPGFSEGFVSVQDAGAQLAAILLEPKDGMRVLDACAAPGGKSVHFLELANIDLLALDIDSTRLARVAENLSRFRAGMANNKNINREFKGQLTLKAADARVPSQWWDGKHFDLVLADVPCSASGIVRRHPDIRWRRQRGDLATFQEQQTEMLNSLWPVVKPGGKLLYVTCSVFRAEGNQVVERFLNGRSNAQRDTIDCDLLQADGYALPQGAYSLHDGFFYARFSKTI